MTIKQINILFGFALLTITVLLILPVNTFYWADDYAFINDLNKHGILQNCINGYYNWDGRSLSLASFVQGFFLKYVKVEITTFFWTFCFLVSTLLTSLCVEDEIGLHKTDKYTFFLLALLIAIGSWLGAYSHFSETIYWATGGFYSFSLLLGALWILCYVKIQNSKIGSVKKVLFFVFSMLVGGTTQNLSFALLTLTTIYILQDYINKIRANNKLNFIIMLALLLGLVFIVIAPGNSIRMEAAGFGKQSFLAHSKNIVYVVFYYFHNTIAAIIIAVLLSFGLFKFNHPNTRFHQIPKIKMPKTKVQLVQLMFDFKWFFVAVSSILPFLILPGLLAKRTMIFFIFFMIFFVLIFCFKLFQNSFVEVNKNDLRSKNKKKSAFYTFLIVLTSAVIFISYNLHKGIILKQAISERECLFKKSKDKTVHIKVINQELTSQCYQFSDFFINVPDKDNYIKTTQELFFGVKIIIDK